MAADFSGIVTNSLMKKVLEDCSFFVNYGDRTKKCPYDHLAKVPLQRGRYMGKCTYGPSTWYNRAWGGIYQRKFGWWNGKTPATVTVEDCRVFMKRYGFVEVWCGTGPEANRILTSSKYLRPGDVATMLGIHGDGSPSAHGVMWTGQDWRSDCIQDSKPYPYSAAARGGNSFILWRHPEFQEPGLDVKGGGLNNSMNIIPGGGSFDGSLSDLEGGDYDVVNFENPQDILDKLESKYDELGGKDKIPFKNLWMRTQLQMMAKHKGDWQFISSSGDGINAVLDSNLFENADCPIDKNKIKITTPGDYNLVLWRYRRCTNSPESPPHNALEGVIFEYETNDILSYTIEDECDVIRNRLRKTDCAYTNIYLASVAGWATKNNFKHYGECYYTAFLNSLYRGGNPTWGITRFKPLYMLGMTQSYDCLFHQGGNTMCSLGCVLLGKKASQGRRSVDVSAYDMQHIYSTNDENVRWHRNFYQKVMSKLCQGKKVQLYYAGVT